MQKDARRKIVVTRACSFMPTGLVLFLVLSMPSREARASGNEVNKTRIYAVLDGFSRYVEHGSVSSWRSGRRALGGIP